MDDSPDTDPVHLMRGRPDRNGFLGTRNVNEVEGCNTGAPCPTVHVHARRERGWPPLPLRRVRIPLDYAVLL